MAAIGGLLGWLASQPPLPDPLPYYVAVPRAGAPAALGAADPDAPVSVTPLAEPEVAEATASPEAAPVEDGRYGPVPVVTGDGRQSWQVYARPYDASDARARIAVVVVGLGRGQADTNKALELPGEVTLAFSPYGEALDDWARQARAAGHEVLLEVPMEPRNFPRDDPGPRALLTSLGPNQNLDRLEWLLARFTGYIGVVDLAGDRFTASEPHLHPLLDELKRRGLVYLDRFGAGSLAERIAGDVGLMRLSADLVLDDEPSRAEIGRRLVAAEAYARRAGSVVLIARTYPVTFDMLQRWFTELDGDALALAPLTAALARRAEG